MEYDVPLMFDETLDRSVRQCRARIIITNTTRVLVMFDETLETAHFF
jgi:hypothetical protein